MAITREVVEYAHERNVEVEAELGKIGATDKIETDNDESLYTDPQEAEEFVARTECGIPWLFPSGRLTAYIR